MTAENPLDAFSERIPAIDELSPDKKDRLGLMVGHVDEVVGLEHLVKCLTEGTSRSGDDVVQCYVGFEPSGKAHIGWKVLSLQLRRMLDADTNVLIFLADWHAWVNDKFGGDMEAIQTTASYMEDTFRALLGNPPEGTGPGQLQFKWASEVMESIPAENRLLIPMKPNNRSLNLSNSVAVVSYEVWRQFGFSMD